MKDTIYRQDAIEALKEERCPCESDYDEGYLSMLDKAIWIMQEWLPSAQSNTQEPPQHVESVGDVISRQAAINAIEEVDWYHQNKNKDMVSGANSSEHQAWYKADDIYKTLEDLPSAQQVTGKLNWIPVTERLPFISEEVLVYHKRRQITVGWRIGVAKWFVCDGYETDDVLAWMPLPEPYKGENDESKSH